MPRVIVFSGAGLSAESGIPTFRSSDGLWAKHSIHKVCNALTWRANFELVHDFYNQRRIELSQVEPNLAHRMIAAWQQRYETILLTQNVDDLLEQAGCSNVIHLHGFLSEMRCIACGHVWNIGHRAWGSDERCPNQQRKCNSCKGVRPNVVFFNEHAPRYNDLYHVTASLRDDDIVVVSGTSEQVIPIGSYLFDRPGYKFFNGLEPSNSPNAYQESQLVPATEAFPLIDQRLRAILGY